jgi:hypothetical protein
MAVLPAAAAVPLPAAAQVAPTQAALKDKLDVASVALGEVGRPVPRFFNAEQFKALQLLSEILMPAIGKRPGAKEAGAAEFLDFLISQSPADRQELYRGGLDRLKGLTSEQMMPLLKPLTAEWTYAGPSDAFAQFLLAAKEDVMRATYNSREFASAMSQTSRGFSGSGYYWFPVE